MESAPRWSLVVAILGSTMAFVDGTVVNVALPIMQRSLNGTVIETQWIVEAYAVFLAALVLVGGALGDRLGRRRVFLAGVLAFAVASMACGLAPNATTLIAARSLQGIGAALLVPGSLSLITAAYPERERGGAIGTWSSTTAITSAAGPVLGGWLIAHASWRWLFFINAPVAAATIWLALRHVKETRDELASKHVDVPGAALAILGLGAIVLGLLQAPRLSGGIANARVLGLVGCGVVVLVAFVLVEARSRAPMVPLSLFASRTFTGANALTLLLYAALGGAFFFLPFDLIQVQGYSPAAAGGALLPLVVLVSVMSPFTGKLAARIGPRPPLVIGPLLAAAGFAWLARPWLGASFWTSFFPGICVLGVGMGLTVAPLTTAVMGSVSEHHTGAASGVNNAVARTASVLAIAALGLVLTSRFDRVVDEWLSRGDAEPAARSLVDAHRLELAGIDLSSLSAPARESTKKVLDDAFVAGFGTLMLVCAALSAIAAALAFALVERRRRP